MHHKIYKRNMAMWLLPAVSAACLSVASCSSRAASDKVPGTSGATDPEKIIEAPILMGETVLDDHNAMVNAHGGMIMEKDGLFYWYGEHRGSGPTNDSQKGVALYTSPDLVNWTNRGIVLATVDSAGHPLERGCIVERPKVVYNPATGKYVMWFHHELKGQGYSTANAAVAIADKPEGPFKLLHTGRVNPGIYPQNLSDSARQAGWDPEASWGSEEWTAQMLNGSFVKRDLEKGQMARDFTVFVDRDGRAYHIYASEENLTLHIAELDPSFTRHTGRYIRVQPGGCNEAPAVMVCDGTYWMFTSGCTGWAPNAARLFKADSIMGHWTALPNPARGEGADTTFGAQSTYILQQGEFYTFMGDIWDAADLGDSRYMWVPVQFDDNDVPYISAPDVPENDDVVL